jgi:hypothetical protein
MGDLSGDNGDDIPTDVSMSLRFGVQCSLLV